MLMYNIKPSCYLQNVKIYIFFTPNDIVVTHAIHNDPFFRESLWMVVLWAGRISIPAIKSCFLSLSCSLTLCISTAKQKQF